MKILVGLDFEDASEHGTATPEAVRILQQLRFPDAGIEVAHAVSPFITPASQLEALLLTAGEDLASAYATERATAKYLVESAAGKFESGADGALGARGIVLSGNAAVALMDRADQTQVDLIAVNGSPRRSLLDVLLTANVARDIVVGAQQSVLIARPGCDTARPIRAVLATDHSLYANRCVELLGRFAPAGIGHLTVLTAYPNDQIQRLRTLIGEMAVDPAEAVRDHLCARNALVTDILSHHLAPGTTFTSRVTPEPVQQAIAQTMAEAEADLLILGAKGHGFVERLLLGSVSFRHAVMNVPYSVLILRA